MHAPRILLALAVLSGTLGLTAPVRAQTVTAPADGAAIATASRPAPLFVTTSGTVVEDPNWVGRTSWQRLLTVFVARPQSATTEPFAAPTRIRDRRRSSSTTSGTTTTAGYSRTTERSGRKETAYGGSGAEGKLSQIRGKIRGANRLGE